MSEEEDITIYNSENNYYVKGGGIVNAETFDEIAKELSLQYWKIYKIVIKE